MTPGIIAEIQVLAERAERLRIAKNIRLLAIEGRASGKSENATAVLDHLADMIERGEFSK